MPLVVPHHEPDYEQTQQVGQQVGGVKVQDEDQNAHQQERGELRVSEVEHETFQFFQGQDLVDGDHQPGHHHCDLMARVLLLFGSVFDHVSVGVEHHVRPYRRYVIHLHFEPRQLRLVISFVVGQSQHLERILACAHQMVGDLSLFEVVLAHSELDDAVVERLLLQERQRNTELLYHVLFMLTLEQSRGYVTHDLDVQLVISVGNRDVEVLVDFVLVLLGGSFESARLYEERPQSDLEEQFADVGYVVDAGDAHMHFAECVSIGLVGFVHALLGVDERLGQQLFAFVEELLLELLEDEQQPLRVELVLDDQRQVLLVIPLRQPHPHRIDRAVVYHITRREIIRLDRLTEVYARILYPSVVSSPLLSQGQFHPATTNVNENGMGLHKSEVDVFLGLLGLVDVREVQQTRIQIQVHLVLYGFQQINVFNFLDLLEVDAASPGLPVFSLNTRRPLRDFCLPEPIRFTLLSRHALIHVAKEHFVIFLHDIDVIFVYGLVDFVQFRTPIRFVAPGIWLLRRTQIGA